MTALEDHRRLRSRCPLVPGPRSTSLHGSFGGRVYPLWADAQATQSNVRADVLQALAKAQGAAVSAEPRRLYRRGHGASRLHRALSRRSRPPGLRVPLTADKSLFDEAVALGCEVVWLHCYGERFVDAAAGRPKARRACRREARSSPPKRHSRRA